jgi:hypothetical protein
VSGLVDGLDRAVPPDALEASLEPAREAYRSQNAGPRLQIGESEGEAEAAISPAARWLLRQLVGG